MPPPSLPLLIHSAGKSCYIMTFLILKGHHPEYSAYPFSSVCLQVCMPQLDVLWGILLLMLLPLLWRPCSQQIICKVCKILSRGRTDAAAPLIMAGPGKKIRSLYLPWTSVCNITLKAWGFLTLFKGRTQKSVVCHSSENAITWMKSLILIGKDICACPLYAYTRVERVCQFQFLISPAINPTFPPRQVAIYILKPSWKPTNILVQFSPHVHILCVTFPNIMHLYVIFNNTCLTHTFW